MINRLLTISMVRAHMTIAALLLVSCAAPAFLPPFREPLNIKVDPNTPVKDLLPTPPTARDQKPSAFADALADVPELMLSEPLAKDPNIRKTVEAIALQIAKANHLNKERSDRFMEEVLADRPDVADLPFQMGNNCRLSSTRSRYFKLAVAAVHGAAKRTGRALPLGITDIMQMTRNGTSNAIIINQIRETNSTYQLSTEDIHLLQTNGVSQNVVIEMQNHPPVVRVVQQSVKQILTTQSLPQGAATPVTTTQEVVVQVTSDDGKAFLGQFLQACLAQDDSIGPNGLKEHRDYANSARLAAMTQICGPTSNSMKLAMARYLASVSSVDSSKALVKTILFTPEEDARNVAIEALKARRDKDYIEPLLQGFRYPWPDVAKRAADALVKLDRKDLIPQIIDVLDEADPRAPVTKKVNGKTVTSVREIVRINHHRNCLMCHPPGQDVQNNADILTAEVPVPGQELPSFNSGGYRSQGFAESSVRIDVTYLRQDFSMMLPVANAAPWPEMQRFDFVARTRTLKDDEVNAYKEKFDKLEPGVLPPNHKAALAALRELTGKDTAPTAEAWRQLVKATK